MIPRSSKVPGTYLVISKVIYLVFKTSRGVTTNPENAPAIDPKIDIVIPPN
jgi:hypothetical protein